MIMGPLARLLGMMTGSWFTMPVMLLGLVIMAHQMMQAKDARLKNEGKQACDASWLVAVANRERDAARLDAKRAQELLEGQAQITEGLRDDLEKTRRKYAAYIPSDDPRCLSDGVLDALRRRKSVGGGS